MLQKTVTRRDARPSATGRLGPAAVSVALLGVHSLVVAARPLEPVSMLVNLGLVAVALWWAIRAGLDGTDLGLDRSAAHRSLAVGLSLAALIVGVVTILAIGSGLPPDQAVSSMTSPALAFRLLIAIPVGTALCEELLFRGVLLAAFDRVLTPWRSTAAVSGVFGLWHVVAEWQRTQGLTVVGGVLATAAASAFVLCPLRRRTRSVVAPIVVHAATNMSVLAAVWLTAR